MKLVLASGSQRRRGLLTMCGYDYEIIVSNADETIDESDPENFDSFCKLMLTSMLSECAKSFERLPILMHGEIIRNILYSGVWSKYEYLQLKKKKKKKQTTSLRRR